MIESDITDAASLVEALDFLPPRPGWTSGHGRSLSAAALDRLTRLASELRSLRSYIGDDLTTLLGEVERAMLLDIEVGASRESASIRRAATWMLSRMRQPGSCRRRNALTCWRSCRGWKLQPPRKAAWMLPPR